MPPLKDAAVSLPDGRRLASAEWGDASGSPLFFFHGTPHSGLWCPDEPSTRAARVRLITVDRPGIGRSDIKEARTFAGFANDVVHLADALGIKRFAVAGWSAGGAYAAACAAFLLSRVTGAGIISSRHLARYNFVERPQAYQELSADERAQYDFTQGDPMAAAELVATQRASWVADLWAHPEITHANLAVEGDQWFFADEARIRDFDAAMREGLRQGTDGLRWELIDGWFPWGFGSLIFPCGFTSGTERRTP